jgi:outer membrane biosynthesis protein TonB
VDSTSIFFDEASERVALDRRFAIAIATSLIVHALALAALRGWLPAPRSFAEGGVGGLPALQAELAGPTVQPKEEEPVPEPEPVINPSLVQPPMAKPIETLFGRKPAATTMIPGGGPTRPGTTSPDVNVAVGTIADPAKLGPDYVTQLAQRFPGPVQIAPRLLGALVVPYPRSALESGIEGRFAAVVTIDATGKVADAKLVVDDPIFGPVMLDTLKNAKFAAAHSDGSPVAYWAIVEFIFSIDRPGVTPSVAQAPPRKRFAAAPPGASRATR